MIYLICILVIDLILNGFCWSLHINIVMYIVIVHVDCNSWVMPLDISIFIFTGKRTIFENGVSEFQF